MIISFGDGAFETFKRTVWTLPANYTIAIGTAAQVDAAIAAGTCMLGVDVQFISADDTGVCYRDLDAEGVPFSSIRHRRWELIEAVHVY